MDQNLAIDCIEVVENLSQKEKNKILSVLKRDDKLRVGQEQKISQLKQEINSIRKNGVLRGGDDQTKMCIRCRAQFGFLFNRGDICPACRFRVCNLCQEFMFNKSWLCKLCYKQRQLKWLTGEWAASFEQNPLRKWASGTDVRHGSLQVFSGATSIDIGEPESNRTNNNRSSKSAHNGILTSSEQDKQRVEYPKEGDQHKLSQLFGVLRSRKPEETTQELQVRRVSTRKYSETDSDSSSSSDVEAPSVTESELDKTESPRSVESPKSRLEAVDEDLNESVESDRVGKNKIAYKSKQKINEDILQGNVILPLQDTERIVRPKVAHSSNRPKTHRAEIESDGSHSQTHPRKKERKKIMPDQNIARELRIQAEESTKVSQSKSVDINLSDPSDNGLVSKRRVVSHTELNSKKLGDPYASRSHESLDKSVESQIERSYVRKSHENLQADSKSGKSVSPVIRHSAENFSPRVRNKVNQDVRRSHESLDTAREKGSLNQNIRQARSHEYLPTKVKHTDEQTVSGQSARDQLEDDYNKKGLQKPVVDIEVTHASIHVSDIDQLTHSEVGDEEDNEIALKGQRAGSPYSFSMDSLQSSNPSPTLRRSIDSSIPESSDTDSLSKLSHHEEFSGTESQVKEGSEDDFTVEEISKVRFQRVSKKAAQLSILGKISSSPKKPGSYEGVDRGQRKSQSRGGSEGSDDTGSVNPEYESKYITVSESPHLIADTEPVVEETISSSEKQSTKAAILKFENLEITKCTKEPDQGLIVNKGKTHLKKLKIPSIQSENINRSRSAMSSTGSEPRSAVDLSWFDEYAVDTKQTITRQTGSTSDAQVFVDEQDTKDKPDSDTDSVEGMIDDMARPHLQVENVRRVTRASEADSEGSFNMTPISPFAPYTFDTKVGTYTLTYMESDDNLDAVSTDDYLDTGSDLDAPLETNIEQIIEKKVVGKKEKQKLKATNSLDVLIAKQKHLLELDQDIVEIDTEFLEALKIAGEADNINHITETKMKDSSQIKTEITRLPEIILQVKPQKDTIITDYDKVDSSFEINEPEVEVRTTPGRNNKSKLVAMKSLDLLVFNQGELIDPAVETVELNSELRTALEQHLQESKSAALESEDVLAESDKEIEPEIQMRIIQGRKDVEKSKCFARMSLLHDFNQGELTMQESSQIKSDITHLPEIIVQAQPQNGTKQSVNKSDKKDTVSTDYDKVDSSFEINEPEFQVRTTPGRNNKSKLVAMKSLDLLVFNQGELIDPAVETVELNSELRTALEQHLQESKSAALESEDVLAVSDKGIEPEIQMEIIQGRKDVEKSKCFARMSLLHDFNPGELTMQESSQIKSDITHLPELIMQVQPQNGTKQSVNKSDKKDTVSTDYDKVDSSSEIKEPEVQVRTKPGRNSKSKLVAMKSLDLLVFNQGELIDTAVETVELDSELRTALEHHLQESKSAAVESEDVLAVSYKEIDYLGMQLSRKSDSASKNSGLVQSEHLNLDLASPVDNTTVSFSQKGTADGISVDSAAFVVNQQAAMIKDNASESEESDVLSVIEEEEEFSESSEHPEDTRVKLANVSILKTPNTRDEELESVNETVCKDMVSKSLESSGSNIKLTDKVKIMENKVRQIGESSESSGHEKYEGYDIKIHSKFKKLQERWNAIEKHEADLLDVDEISNLDNQQSKTVDRLEFDIKAPSSTEGEKTEAVPICPSLIVTENSGSRVQVDESNTAEIPCVSSKTDYVSQYQDGEHQIDRVEMHSYDDFKDIVMRTAETLNISIEKIDSSAKSLSYEGETDDENESENCSEKEWSETRSDDDNGDHVSETELCEVQMRSKSGRTNTQSVNKEKVNENDKEMKESDNFYQIHPNKSAGNNLSSSVQDRVETCQSFKENSNEQDVRHTKENTDCSTEICQSPTDEYIEMSLFPSRLSINDKSGICQSLTDLNSEIDPSILEEIGSDKIKPCGSEIDKQGQDLNTHEDLARCQSSGEEREWQHPNIVERELQHLNIAVHESISECQSIAEGDSHTFYVVPEDSDRCISIDERSFTEWNAKSNDIFVDDSNMVLSENSVSQTDKSGTDRHEEDSDETVHRPLVRLSKLRKGVKATVSIAKSEFGDLDRSDTFIVKKQLSDSSTQGVHDQALLETEDSPIGLKDKEIETTDTKDEHKGIGDTENLSGLTIREEQDSDFPPEPQCFKVPNVPFKLESRLSSSSAPSSPDLSIDLPFTPMDSPRSDKVSSHRMSPQTISESSMSPDDSGLASGGSRGTTPEHKRTDSGYSQSSLPSTLSTVTDRSTEDEEDIDKVLARMKTTGGRGNLLSVMADSRESIASFYSDAGDIAYSNIPVTGEILFGLNYNYKTGMLEVHIKQCRDIAAVDTKRRRSDPYVKTYLLPDKTRSGKRKTKVKKHTLNPTFDEQLKYSISKSELENRTLWLTVWHNDRFGRNDFLGEVTINFDYYKFDDPSPKWYPLQERLDAQPTSILTYKGDIVLSVRYVPGDKVKTTEFKGKTKRDSGSGKGQLHVVVKEARNLTAVRSNGFSDPFCKGYLLPERHRSSKQKTVVIKKNCSPAWNHTFIFEDVSLLELQERCLELTIWDYEKLASNDFLGGTRLNLGTGLSQGKPVDWMDARGEEMTMWQAMLDRPNIWIDGTLILRPNMEKRKF